MENLDDSENNAKISDSAYSNSCSNSQSRRSHSSKSTHSGSHSSGSSGYGGKQSTSNSSNNLCQPPKKEIKKKKLSQIVVKAPSTVVEMEMCEPEPAPDFKEPAKEMNDAGPILSPGHKQSEKVTEILDVVVPEMISVPEETAASNSALGTAPVNYCASRATTSYSDGFSCVISMHDGVVMYTTTSLTATLGFPKDMWLGRSFIDFIHPKDRYTFASQITNGFAIPKIATGTQEKVQYSADSLSTMVCRIRRYRGLSAGYSVKEKAATFMPFLLKLTFRNGNSEEGKVIYLVIEATPFFSAFKTPCEVVTKPMPFVIRHAANGNIEFVDPEAVPYLGYMPQDLMEKNALLFYHPDDLSYLTQVYETIVKEGGLQRSKPYRMIAHNGGFVKVETEWSSFINPWSRKLEFVIAKHHVVEGPVNPDVFRTNETEKSLKISEEEKSKTQLLRDNIIRTMNEVLTKPAEVAKQQMSKRCQDLASFMETLMEEQPRADEEMHLEIQDPEHSYYERDSVMLGGISPHHNDSKSSTETPLSYNQLNYNKTLQRYFESHQPYSYKDYNIVAGDDLLGFKDSNPEMNASLSPLLQLSEASGGVSSSGGSNLQAFGSACPSPVGEPQPQRLTETLLNKHNTEMEKELMKIHRVRRSSIKGDREKETRQKTKEHLARCNASYQPTSAGATLTESQAVESHGHGVKRGPKYMDSETNAHKQHCTASARMSRRRRRTSSPSAPNIPTTSTITTSSSHWLTPSAVGNTNTFFLGVGIVSPVPTVPGMFPIFYAPPTTASSNPVGSNDPKQSTPSTSFQPPAMQCMMYSQPMYTPPFMCSSLNPHGSCTTQQQSTFGQSLQYTSINPLGLTSSNYEEACKLNVSLNKYGGVWHDKKRAETKMKMGKQEEESGDSNSSIKALNREFGASNTSAHGKSTIYSTDMKSSSNSHSFKSTETVPDQAGESHPKNGSVNKYANSKETVDRTDGESSYSSFYSSFFKTESGSAEDSGDAKKVKWNIGNHSSFASTSKNVQGQKAKNIPKRKIEPPWLEQVCVTSDLIYKYQVVAKKPEELLSADKHKINTLEQPSLVNDQLEQLYMDLQLEGVTARLTLEEGITSSSSSGEDITAANNSGRSRRKREYSKLMMIYEEDAPLPPSSSDVEIDGPAKP